jgi:RNA polymerase sigma factor (sigma-70 family)
MENLNLIRKIAQSFAETSGIDYDDLCQEASLAYLEAMTTYDSSKGKISTYVWHCIHNRLKNYLKQEEKNKALSFDEIEVSLTTRQIPFWEKLSSDAQKLANIVLASPDKFLKLRKTSRLQAIKDEIQWKKPKFEKVLSEIKFNFS